MLTLLANNGWPIPRLRWFEPDRTQGDSATFIARYSYEAHIKGITALGLAGKTLVSGGADEFIK